MTLWYPCSKCGTVVDEFQEEYNEKARVCLACSRYLSHPDLITQERTTPYIKVVEKSWGRERWIANSPMYCSKFLDIKFGDGTSIHHHEKKFETMTVIYGKFRIMLEDEIFFMYPGDILNISPYQIHKLDAVCKNVIETDTAYEEYCTLLEISTQHFDDDSIRHGRDLRKYLKDKQ